MEQLLKLLYQYYVKKNINVLSEIIVSTDALNDEDYRYACGQATKLLNQGLSMVLMIPTTSGRNSITFDSGGGVTITSDIPSITGTKGFQLPTTLENAILHRVFSDGENQPIYTNQNFQIDNANNEIFSADAGSLMMVKTVTQYPIGIIGNFYNSSSFVWINKL